MLAPARSPRLEELRHSHDHGTPVASHDTRTRWVVALTFAMMVAQGSPDASSGD